jgi:hypothetical protein
VYTGSFRTPLYNAERPRVAPRSEQNSQKRHAYFPGTDMDKNELLRAIQQYTAKVAIGGSSMRGAGSVGVVRAARAFLGTMPLRPFGTSSDTKFLSLLDGATDDLERALPEKAQHWGLARKGLNIFLRNCLYTTYLRDEYHLALAENFFEVPLDSITGERLVSESEKTDSPLEAWETIRGLEPKTSKQYQAVAASLAADKHVARVHLDAVWWGEQSAE